MSADRPPLIPLALASLLAMAPAVAHASGAPASSAFDPADLDPKVAPGDDFFHYVNGGWIARTPIPPDESRWGGFEEVVERNRQILHEILERAAASPDAPAGSPARMVGDFYASAMDSAAIEKAGAGPLGDELERIAAIRDPAGLEDEFARLQTYGVRAPFALAAVQDFKSSTEVIVNLNQAGLGLPDRDYYTKSDDASKRIRDQYVMHVGRMFGLLGDDPATAAREAATVMDVETRLANASLTRVERRDPTANYHRVPFDSLATVTPDLSWTRLYQGMGITDRRPVNVGQPGFFRQLDGMMASVPIADWRTYLRWHLIHSTGEYLSTPFVDEDFDFNLRVLTGATALKPRWKRALGWVDMGVGEQLGQLYVARAFSPEARARAQQLVANLRAELRDRIQHLSWMSDATRANALHKLDAFAVKIGYPDHWRDYTGLKIDRGPLVLNVMRAREFEFRRNVAKLGRPVDRGEWGMTPPTVNAYYNPRMNEIVFPAGILQPPFFDAKIDDAVNYGGIGAVIGHEMTHGFDDQGRKSDADGNLKDWWTPADQKAYDARAVLVQKQFDGYVAVDTLHVNGRLTLGENLADLGGLSIAFGALEKTLGGKPGPKIDGLTPEQRFFMSYARVWRQSIRPEAQRLRIATDPHSPGRFRCNGPLSNMPEFAHAFGIADGAPMVRPADQRAKIW
ncbi:MAG TPA: M13 family metallopeptidase [Dongiaceae bacterium]|nr:M13 family metallopeptidase [Dongiaceae bacterium]